MGFPHPPPMREAKNTQRSVVRIGYDGRVHKTYRGPRARERFDNEVLVLRTLEERGCDHVPRLLNADPANLTIITSNCGARVEHLTEAKVQELFSNLEHEFGIRHDDPFDRNVTYRSRDGRFCIIDFEFAVILPDPKQPGTSPNPATA